MTLLRLHTQARCSTASARRTTDTRCRPPRGTAPRAWRRSPPSPLPPSPPPPRLTSQVSQPRPSPAPRPRPPGLWTRARASVLLPEPPRPPPQTAPSAPPPASAGEPGARPAICSWARAAEWPGKDGQGRAQQRPWDEGRTLVASIVLRAGATRDRCADHHPATSCFTGERGRGDLGAF